MNISIISTIINTYSVFKLILEVVYLNATYSLGQLNIDK